MTGNVLNNLGFIHQQLQRPDAAADSYREAVRFQSRATELAPEVDKYRVFLSKHRHNLAEFGGRS